jgi:hypothetical protein
MFEMKLASEERSIIHLIPSIIGNIPTSSEILDQSALSTS